MNCNTQTIQKSIHADEALHDCFVHGLRSSGMCTKSSSDWDGEPLMLKKALEVAIAVDATDQKAKELYTKYWKHWFSDCYYTYSVCLFVLYIYIYIYSVSCVVFV